MYSDIPHVSAVVQSWSAPFIGGALQALLDHVNTERRKEGAYTSFCSIVQSSGMGKSRLLDELSKTHFLIPVNLHETETRGVYDSPVIPYYLSFSCF